MLNREETKRVYQHAYLPEHLVEYVESISGAEPHLHENYLSFFQKKHLIFIGYPLGNTQKNVQKAYHWACEHFQPSTVAILAPEIWLSDHHLRKRSTDAYYRIQLPLLSLDPAVEYMVRRAKRELNVTEAKYDKVHGKLIREFISTHDLPQEQQHIFKQIPQYLKTSTTARLLEARKENVLVAFSIVDLGAADYAFNLFNFRSSKEMIPGASDLLFSHMIQLAQSGGKTAINLGLGIHPGIRRFKEKWGGVPFCSYASALVVRKSTELDRLMNKL